MGLTIAVGVAYFFAAQLSLNLLTKPDGVAVFWPAAGIASGTLLALGSGARLPVTLGVAVASAAASLLGDRSIAAAIVFALCNVGEPLLVAWLINRRFGNNFRLESLRSVLGFFVAAGIGPGISGSVATVGFILFYHSEAPVLTTWLNWFASDALGIIMVAPLLIGLGSLRHDFPKKRELASGTLTLAVLVIVTAITFGSPTHHWYTVLPLGMLLPALLAAYCRPVFAAAAALVLGFAVVWTTTFGIVDLSDLHDRVNAARSTLPAISICTLVLAALFAERRHKEKALKDSNDLLADGLQAGQVMTFEWDATTGQSRRSDNACFILGDEGGELAIRLGCEFVRNVHPDDQARIKARIRNVCPDDPGYVLSYRFRGLNGREVWLEEEAKGEFDATGKLLRITGLTRDITERKRAELALAERTMQLALAGKVGRVGFFAYDADTGNAQVSEGYATIHGLPEGTTEIARSQWQDGVHPDDLLPWEDLRTRAFRERRKDFSGKYRVVRADGEIRWIEARVFVSYHSDGRPQRTVGVDIDITERQRAEEHQRTLRAELDHRVKNVLATVSAIITQTPKADDTLADFVVGLDDRIKSLARTHELLSQSHWHGVSLEEIVRRQLTPFTSGNVTVDGPHVVLKADAAQALAMVLHELTTNAAKHGAFSKKEGRLLLRWRWLQNGSSGRLAIEWQELSGPTVLRPCQFGYGTSIVLELIPFELGGTADLDFATGGVRCRLEIPARWVRRADPASDENRGLDALGPNARD
jgi:PAS domain S-box-containing protein